jgi:hypothetical protein
MNPLIEVSTDGGRNMRETCARVLAAALMTGAIATVVAMSAVLGAPSEAGRPIAAPPSSVQRIVRLTAQPAPRHQRTAARHVTAHTIHARPTPAVVTRSLAVVRPHRVRRPVHHRQLAAAKPPPTAPVAPPAPAVAGAPAPPAEPAPPPTAEDADNGDDGDPGHGHDHGHGQEHGHGRSDQDE